LPFSILLVHQKIGQKEYKSIKNIHFQWFSRYYMYAKKTADIIGILCNF
jgi:hypothetical protein